MIKYKRIFQARPWMHIKTITQMPQTSPNYIYIGAAPSDTDVGSITLYERGMRGVLQKVVRSSSTPEDESGQINVRLYVGGGGDYQGKNILCTIRYNYSFTGGDTEIDYGDVGGLLADVDYSYSGFCFGKDGMYREPMYPHQNEPIESYTIMEPGDKIYAMCIHTEDDITSYRGIISLTGHER